MTDARLTSSLTDTKKPTNLALLTPQQRLDLLETMKTDGSAGVGAEIPQESARPWENQSIGMVVSGLLRDRKTAWISRRR
jgi:hypothetical protein